MYNCKIRDEKDCEYKINRLIMVKVNDKYSLYSFEKGISPFHTSDGLRAFYLYDVVDHKNGLLIYLNVPIEEDDYNIIFGDGESATVKSFEITSLDKEYARSFKNCEYEIAIGDDWKEVKIPGTIWAKTCKFSSYLTFEQESRGYLTQEEVEEIVRNLNEQKTLTKK